MEKHRKPKFEIGDTFAGGQIKIIRLERCPRGRGVGWRYIVECKCGNERPADSYQLTSRAVKGCLTCDPPKPKVKIKSGERKLKLSRQVLSLIDAAWQRHLQACRRTGCDPEPYAKIAAEIQEWPDLAENDSLSPDDLRESATIWNYRQYEAPVQNER